jgi:hypothetical protein
LLPSTVSGHFHGAAIFSASARELEVTDDRICVADLVTGRLIQEIAVKVPRVVEQ